MSAAAMRTWCWPATWWWRRARTGLATIGRGTTRVVLNTYEMPTGDFVLDTDTRLPAGRLKRNIIEAAGADNVELVNATALATALLGDAIATNLFMLGYAFQKGKIPLTLDALFRAIELNGTAVDANKAAFTWGRCAGVDTLRVATAAGVQTEPPKPPTLDELIEQRAAHLTSLSEPPHRAPLSASSSSACARSREKYSPAAMR